jgi:hypothetical protein
MIRAIRARLQTIWRSRRAWRLAAIVVAVLALYGALGFWVAPGIVREQIVTRVSEALDRPVTLDAVRINPYALSLTLSGFAVSERDGSPLLAFDKLHVNLSSSSLLRWAWTLSEIRLLRPRVQLVLTADGALNLAALGPTSAPASKDQEPTHGLLRLAIGQLSVIDGQVGFEDRRQRQPVHRNVDAISFTLHDFSTLPEDEGEHSFSAVTDAGERLQWRGEIGVNPLQSTGRLALSGIGLAQIAPYILPDSVRLTAGTLDIETDYSLRIAPNDNEFALSSGRIKLNAVQAQVNTVALTPINFDITPITLRWRGLATKPGQRAEVALELVPNGAGRIALQGSLGFDPLAADLRVSVTDVALAPFQPFIEPYARARIERGAVTVNGTLVLRAAQPLDVRFDGEAAIADLSVADTQSAQTFVRWQRLGIEKLAYTSHPAALNIARIRADRPYLRLLIGPDRITNLQHILAVGGERPAATATPAPNKTPAGGTALRTRIGVFAVHNGSANFADHSLQPNFETGIQQLNGTAKGLSSEQLARAEVDIKGKVDQYAPVTIQGQINPLAEDAFTDIGLRFEGIELTTFTPYSGKFAGFRIDKGKLNLDLHYRLSQKVLRGDNKVVIDQLTLGEQVDSPDMLHLPIRLAIALLKDSHGVIDIDLPVRGDLNDPDFRYGALIGKAIVNLITGIVTAPFKALANLVGGSAEEMSQVAFAPGSDALQLAEQEKLRKLSAALVERPALRLEIRGTASPEQDRRALAKQMLMKKVRGGAKASSPEPLGWLERRRLYALYRETFKADPDALLPALKPGERRTSDQENAMLVAAVSERLLTTMPVTDDALRSLARARANNVKVFLLEQTGINAERLYLLDIDTTVKGTYGAVATQLSLQAG